MHFKDGTTAEADVVLVANGVKSTIRGMVMADAGVDKSAADPKATEAVVEGVSYANAASYRGLVVREHAKALGVDTSIWRSPMLLVAKNKVRDIYVACPPVRISIRRCGFSMSLYIP